jgi:hypothetical protein
MGRSRLRRGRLLAALAAGALLAAGLAAAGLVFLPRILPPPAVLPFGAEHLPRTTERITTATYGAVAQLEGHVAAPHVPDEAIWSALAEEPCDGPDLYELFLGVADAPEKAPDPTLDRLARALGPDLQATQLALRCGRDLARDGKLSAAGRTWRLEFKDGAKTRTILVLPLQHESMPDTEPPYEKRSFRDHRGACKPAMKKGDDGKDHPDKCTDDSQAVAMTEQLWFHASLANVDTFVRAYDKPADELPIAAEVISGLAPSLDGCHYSDVSTSREVDFGSLLAGSGILFGVPELGPLPLVPRDRAKKTADVLATRIRGVGTGYAMPEAGSPPRVRLAVLAKDDDGAKTVETELVDFHKEWRAHLENRADDIGKPFQDSVKDAPDVVREYKESLFDLLMRGVLKAEVRRSGNVVTLDLAPAPKDQEARAIREYLAARKTLSATAARAVRALASGREAEPADLQTLGGERFTKKLAALSPTTGN